jgi:hypothetical protein
MNSITISIFAIVITAALALVVPVTHVMQHEEAVLIGHAHAPAQARSFVSRWV